MNPNLVLNKFCSFFSISTFTFYFQNFRDSQTKEQRQSRIDSIVENEKKRKSMETSEETQARLGMKAKKRKNVR